MYMYMCMYVASAACGRNQATPSLRRKMCVLRPISLLTCSIANVDYFFVWENRFPTTYITCAY